MIGLEVNVFLGFLQIGIQALAAVYFYLAFKKNREKWMAYVVWALFFMILRRITAIMGLTGMWTVEIIDKVFLPLFISFLLLRAGEKLFYEHRK